MKKVFLLIGGVMFVTLMVLFLYITNGLSEGKNVVLNGIDLTNISDGMYVGTYDFKRWTNTVHVHVKDNEIISIVIVEDETGSDITDCSGEILRRVLDAQNTQVDAVTGATVTSKAYLKAIENALNN